MMIAAVILPKVARIRAATNGLVIGSAKPDRRHKQSQVDSSAAKSQKTKELKRWHCQGGTDLKQMCSALKKRSPVSESEGSRNEQYQTKVRQNCMFEKICTLVTSVTRPEFDRIRAGTRAPANDPAKTAWRQSAKPIRLDRCERT